MNAPALCHLSLSATAALKSWALVVTCVVFVLVNSVYFFGNSWTPKLLTLAGMSQNEGIGGGQLFSLGAVIGTLIFAALAIRFPAMWVACGFALGGAVLFSFMSIVSTQLNPVLISTALLGVCLMATFTGLYVMVPILFRPEARVSAMGIAAGLGRVGSIAAPMIVGRDGGPRLADQFDLPHVRRPGFARSAGDRLRTDSQQPDDGRRDREVRSRLVSDPPRPGPRVSRRTENCAATSRGAAVVWPYALLLPR
ncbi:hypothetical protein [Rhodococcus sp. IEGM 1379]|uniref:hypothetical protein n=1 Tax=Rhodococcus sp. IEGM 1379 TaxID=3047086 RepID=UPI0024B821EC|nr:hypothetical protein [Rhodococcus sp. IEGM 1379]MDI9915044.1 hypothetical protein [Rhodococcus sp. IEGM 1379]